MESSKLGFWLQVGGNIGILLGLVFVGVQLYQDRQLKRAEFIHANFIDAAETQRWIGGESPTEALVKVVDREPPVELSDAELAIVVARLDIQFSAWERNSWMERLGVFEGGWREGIGLGISYFQTPLGRRWLNAELTARPSVLNEAARNELL